MEDNPNVSNLRAATAIFYLDGEAWSSERRYVLTLLMAGRLLEVDRPVAEAAAEDRGPDRQDVDAVDVDWQEPR